ncbi:MAG TPA: ComF family protein [Nitrospiria bacterium]|nr:ComF family protein [Nitrospiria bacterium]
MTANPFFCPDCWDTMPRLSPPWCPRCGLPFVSTVALRHSPTHLCAACREREPPFDWARSAVAYEGVAASAVHVMKYQRRRLLARPLGELLLPLAETLGPVDGVVPVPLHAERLREREFNQALALARVVCRETGWPLRWSLLERIRPTRSQVGLDAVERRRNVRRAFRVRDDESAQGERLLLIDDVMTTGSTVHECARVLKRAGASSVQVLTVARQLRDGLQRPTPAMNRSGALTEPDGRA